MSATSPRSIHLGLIGSGIQLSRTPALHEEEGRANGLALTYELIDLEVRGVGVDQLPSLLEEVQKRGFAGVNVTHPAKQQVIPLLDDLSDEARSLGAVNTVVLRDRRRVGHNTDCSGFAAAFQRGLPEADLGHVVQLGAGGAGSAVAHAIAGLGAKRLTIVDRDTTRAEALAKQVGQHFPAVQVETGTDLEQTMAEATGLINATPVGMASYPGLPLPADLLQSRHWVAEIIYFPLETELLRVARAKGCATIDGGGMAVFQAVHAFRLFTGIEPDPARMLAHFAAMIARG